MIKIKEIFGPTIEGEGSFTGTKSIFVRLSGCNIWDGKAETKAKSACPYCDTDFVGGEMMTPVDILNQVIVLGTPKLIPLINITGGEPLLQNIDELCKLLIKHGYIVNIETNGTKALTNELKHLRLHKDLFITCSPKVNKIKIHENDIDCLKVLYPHNKVKVENFINIPADKYLQPIEINNEMDYETCIKKLYELEGNWKLSVQLHKIVGVD